MAHCKLFCNCGRKVHNGLGCGPQLPKAPLTIEDRVNRAIRDTATRCAEIAEANYRYVTPEDDFWKGVRHGYKTMAALIRREFGDHE